MTKLKCPTCDADIDVIQEFKNWIDMFGIESGGNAFINFACKCREGGFVIDMYSYSDTEEICSPVGTVNFPKLN